jgi:hypothetical protein
MLLAMHMIWSRIASDVLIARGNTASGSEQAGHRLIDHGTHGKALSRHGVQTRKNLKSAKTSGGGGELRTGTACTSFCRRKLRPLPKNPKNYFFEVYLGSQVLSETPAESSVFDQ